jgi:hypothetical protein
MAATRICLAVLFFSLWSVPARAGNRPRPVEAPLWLQVLEATSPPIRRAPPAGATLVMNSLSEPRRQALAAALRSLSATLAKRRNPFYVALDDSDERASVQKLLSDTTPIFTAAAALAAGRWQSSEGDLVLRPVVRCARGARCVPVLGAQPTDELGKRAHFLAWPLGYAVLLRAPSLAEAARVADRLRAEPAASQVALVLTSADLHQLRKSPSLRDVTGLAAMLVRRQPDLPFAEVLKKLAAATSASNELPWLKLPAESVLVVPRLGSLATADRFVTEVRGRLGDAQVEWLATPH